MFPLPASLGLCTPHISTSYIQSIQQVEITIATSATTGTATISAVNTANAVIIWGGCRTTDTLGLANQDMARIDLTNSTTVTATRSTLSLTDTVIVCATIVEFTSAAITSVQYGNISFSTVQTTKTATISSVNTSYAVVLYLGVASANTGSTTSSIYTGLQLTNSTTVTATRNSAGGFADTVGYCVVEFASALIQSVQAGTMTSTSSATTMTATITSITTANTVLLYDGATTASNNDRNSMFYLTLTNSTTVTATRVQTGTSTRTVYFFALEFKSGILKSKQSGTTALTSSTSNTSSITSVNTAKAFINYQNFSTSSATGAFDELPTAKLTNSTTVTCAKGGDIGDTTTVGWEIIEFN